MDVPKLRDHPLPRPQPGSPCIDAEQAPSAAPGRISIASLVSALTLLGLIGGLGYGGYALLQDLQRVGVGPMPLAPKMFAEAPLIAPPVAARAQGRDGDRTAHAWDRMFLAGTAAELRPPELPGRDGPISAIDPDSSGLLAPSRAAAAERPAPGPASDEAPRTAGPAFLTPDGPNGGPRIALSPDEAARAAPLLAAAEAGPPQVVLHATDEVWIRVREGEAIIFEGILPPGGQYEVPERVEAPLLRAGNAGALYVLVDEAPYGPVGTSAAVLKNMSLRAEDITGQVRTASARAVCAGMEHMPLLRTAANLSQ